MGKIIVPSRYPLEHEYQHAMGAAPTAASTSKSLEPADLLRISTDCQWHLAVAAYWCPLARSAQTLKRYGPWCTITSPGQSHLNHKVKFISYRLSQKDSWNCGTKRSAKTLESMVVTGMNRILDFN
jgi:hypothetical protein